VREGVERLVRVRAERLVWERAKSGVERRGRGGDTLLVRERRERLVRVMLLPRRRVKIPHEGGQGLVERGFQKTGWTVLGSRLQPTLRSQTRVANRTGASGHVHIRRLPERHLLGGPRCEQALGLVGKRTHLLESRGRGCPGQDVEKARRCQQRGLLAHQKRGGGGVEECPEERGVEGDGLHAQDGLHVRQAFGDEGGDRASDDEDLVGWGRGFGGGDGRGGRYEGEEEPLLEVGRILGNAPELLDRERGGDTMIVQEKRSGYNDCTGKGEWIQRLIRCTLVACHAT
jgi:hypothetical protein